MLLGRLERDDRPKRYFDGTHRTVAPSETLERIRPLLSEFGITRLSDITGLDRIGIPVSQAIRPMSRSLSVAQGKGLTPDAARVSAAMEGIEAWHAETMVLTSTNGSAKELAAKHRVVDLSGLDAAVACGPNSQTAIDRDDVSMSWTTGVNLLDKEPILVPEDCVFMDFTKPAQTDFLIRSTHGLASGNTLAEAASAALFEVIERDAAFEFEALSEAARRSRRIDLEQPGDEVSKALIAQIIDAGSHLDLWDMTGSCGIPAFHAAVYDVPDANGYIPVARPGLGWGCHCDPDVARVRAITEAVQSRLMVIGGIRDDLSPEAYRSDGRNGHRKWEADFDHLSNASRNLMKAKPPATQSAAKDMEQACSAISRTGCDQIVLVDLTHTDFAIPVVRVVVPNMALVLPGHQFKRVPRQRTHQKQAATKCV